MLCCRPIPSEVKYAATEPAGIGQAVSGTEFQVRFSPSSSCSGRGCGDGGGRNLGLKRLQKNNGLILSSPLDGWGASAPRNPLRLPEHPVPLLNVLCLDTFRWFWFSPSSRPEGVPSSAPTALTLAGAGTGLSWTSVHVCRYSSGVPPAPFPEGHNRRRGNDNR